MQPYESNPGRLLAAEYVLGTLEGETRQDFIARLATDTDLVREVATWQVYLNALAFNLEPVAPGPWVWQRIEQRLGLTADKVQTRRESSELFSGLGLWRTTTALAAACALVLAIFVYRQPAPGIGAPGAEIPLAAAPTPQTGEPDTVTAVSAQALAILLTDKAARTGWLIVQPTPESPLVARAVSPQPLPEGKAYELWLLPQGQAPISMGLAPTQGEATLRPPPKLADLIEPGVALAISLEPSGGSPTGLPTGPVLYQGKVVVM